MYGSQEICKLTSLAEVWKRDQVIAYWPMSERTYACARRLYFLYMTRTRVIRYAAGPTATQAH